MRRILFIVIITAVLCCTLILSAYAGGGGMSGGALETTQLANNSELGAILGQEVEQISNQVKQITNQLNQYNEMLKQGLKLPTSFINDVSGQLQSLQTAVRQTVGLYQSYGRFVDSLERMLDAPLSSNALDNAVTRSRQATATLNAIANKIDQTIKQIERDNQVIEELHGRSANAVGQMQALQAGNEIAVAIAQEINKLRNDINILQSQLLAIEAERQQAKSEDIYYDRQMQSGELDDSTVTTDFDH